MSDACRALGIPVVGGNVSFYNESRGRDIDPTPVVGVVGLIDELDVGAAGAGAPRRRRHRAARSHRARARRLGVGGSARSARRHAPRRRPRGRRRAARVRARAGRRRAASPACTTCSDGGLAVALAEMAIAGECGFTVALGSELVPSLAWFSESASRVVVALDPALRRRPGRAGPRRQRPGPAPRHRGRRPPGRRRRLRRHPGRRHHAWRDALPAALGHPTARLGTIDRESTLVKMRVDARGAIGILQRVNDARPRSATPVASSVCTRPVRAWPTSPISGLYALQHRGQESAGIAVSDGQTITVSKDMGLVTQVFDERRLAPLDGPPGHRPRALLHHRFEQLAQRPAGVPLGRRRRLRARPQRQPHQHRRARRAARACCPAWCPATPASTPPPTPRSSPSSSPTSTRPRPRSDGRDLEQALAPGAPASSRAGSRS